MSASKIGTEPTIDVPPAVVALARAVRAKGGQAYLVGGSVRDALLDKVSKDLDVEVFGLDVDQLERLLRRQGRVNAVGKSFGVLKWRPRDAPDLGEVDVSIPRRDSNVGPGHRGIAVVGDPTMTIEEAVARRDLTINAILYDPVEQRLIDPSNGRADLHERRLQAVDPSCFLEDPLRALRVIQFAARLGFRPTPELTRLCQEAPLEELPAERIQLEWGKLLLKGEHMGMAFQLAQETAVLERVMPSWPDVAHGKHLDALRSHRRRILGREDPQRIGRAWAVMLTGWLAGAPPAVVEDILDRLWLHKVAGYPLRARVLAAVANLDHPLASDADLRHLSTHAEVETVASVRSAHHDPTAPDALHRAVQLGVLHHKPAPLLQGRSLRKHMASGPHMGVVLAAVYKAQLDGTVCDADTALAYALRLIPDVPP